MAQQTTPTTTIIQDLQCASFKILELSKKYEIPEKDVIEVNDYLLKIYKKVNNLTTHLFPPQEPEGPPPPLNQANLTYTYTYTFNNNNNNNNNEASDVSDDVSEEEPQGEYYDYTPRGKITTSITSTTIEPASSELIDVEYFNNNPRRL